MTVEGTGSVVRTLSLVEIGTGTRGSRLSRRASIAVQKRRVFAFLVSVTAAVAVLTGLIAHLIDGTDFPSFGIGVWWRS